METLSVLLNVAQYAGWIIPAFYITWGWYLSIMHLKTARNQGKLTKTAKVIAYPWLVIGLLVDVLFNLVVGTLVFAELPREFLFTTRVSRLNDDGGWRGKLSRWFCSELLDPFDPAGKHCR